MSRTYRFMIFGLLYFIQAAILSYSLALNGFICSPLVLI